NDHFLNLSGYSSKGIAEKKLSEIFYELDFVSISKTDKQQTFIDTFCICSDLSKKSVRLKPFITTSDNGKPEYVLIIVDVNYTVQVDIKKKNELLVALTEINLKYIAGVSLQSIFNELLEVLIKLTQSEFGFIGEVKYAPYGRPYLKVHSFTNIMYTPETQKLYEEYSRYGLEFHNLDNLFGAVITSRDVVISNNPEKDPRAAKAMPVGHPEIKSFLGLPFKKGNTVVGVAGVANRPGGYTPDIVEYLTPFMATCTTLIEAARVETSKRDVEASLKKSLDEKIVLLREVHHRVKNNFQVITSLLNIHLNRAKDETVAKNIENIRNRILAMAIVHEMLYRTDDLSRVNMADYLKRISINLFQSSRVDSSRIKLKLNIEPIQLNVDKAVAIGIIANELLSNSILHAFPGGLNGEIYVELAAKPGAGLVLTIADNGVGLPEGFSIDQLNSLGLQICSQFLSNYNGKITFSSSDTYRTIFTATIPFNSD
ncbi:MAG: histidine kinase dimerization/phosphoacceptor domain -containing protein, partial [Verrucomicrobiia bacterium]